MKYRILGICFLCLVVALFVKGVIDNRANALDTCVNANGNVTDVIAADKKDETNPTDNKKPTNETDKDDNSKEEQKQPDQDKADTDKADTDKADTDKVDQDKVDNDKADDDKADSTQDDDKDKTDKGDKPEEDQKEDVKKVYLTFDDGPSEITEKILDELAKYNATATFFVTGHENDFAKKMYKRIVDEGHTLAMHSYSHQYSTLYQSKKSFDQDFNKISKLLYDSTGVKPKFYRFPGGSSNTVSKTNMSVFIKDLKEKDITYFDWNISSEDATGKKITKQEIVNNVCSNLQYYSVPVVLMHDLQTKQTTLDALPDILKYIYDNDMVAAAIDEDTKPIQHRKE